MQLAKKYLNLIILLCILAVDFVLAPFILANSVGYNKVWKSAKICDDEKLVPSYAIMELKEFPSKAYVNVGGVYNESECELNLSFNVDGDYLLNGKVMPGGSFTKYIENYSSSSNGWIEILSNQVSAKFVKLSVKGELSINEIVFLDSDGNLIDAEVVLELVDGDGYKWNFDGTKEHALTDAQNSFTLNKNRYNLLSTFEKDIAFAVETFLAGGGYASQTVSPLTIIVNALGVLTFGNSVLGIRIISFLFSVISVALIWLLLYKEFNFKNKLLGITDLALVSVAVCGLGYFANAYILALPFAILSVYFIVKNFKNEFNYTKSLAFILISGALASFCVATSSRLILLNIAEIILLCVYANQKVDKNNKSRVLAIGLVGYLVLPLIVYLFTTYFAFSVYSSAYANANLLYLSYKNFTNILF